jgi:predicted metalloprotease with PDZ domain
MQYHSSKGCGNIGPKTRFPASAWIAAGILLLILAGGAFSQTGPVRYAVRLDKQPASHFLHMSVEVDSGRADSVDFAMPAWSPGAYSIHNAWKNVQEFAATDETGARLNFEKVDKQTWRVHRGPGKVITARYALFDRNYNADGCYLRGPSVFMYVVGKRPYPLEGPVSVKILDAPDGWTIQTGMEPGGENTSFQADSYDTFVDASIVLSPLIQQTSFEYQGVPYYLVFIGKGNYDKEKITTDIGTVVRNLVDLMGGAPYKKYVFFLSARAGRGSGGLEHLNSTDITFSAYETHSSRDNYSRFIFVAAHEFFHLWNVKRIRPAILGPFDYTKEQNTRNLYVSEGMTSYWAAVGMRRSGFWSREDYFGEVAKQIEQLQSDPGRKMMSVELSSWDTWNRGDNAANNHIDYYNKGELLGNLLDLEIRYRTGNQRSLTDVFRYLYKNHGLPKPGFEEKRGFRDAVELITKEAAPSAADFGDFFARYVSGTDEIPWNDFLDHAGLELVETKGKAVPYIGISTGTQVPGGGFGGGPSFTQLPQGQLAITNVAPGSPAAKSGLDTGDVLLAIDGDKVDPATFNARFGMKQIGTPVAITVMRGDRMLTRTVSVGQEEKVTYSIKEKAEPTAIQKQILASWLGEK